MDPLGPAAPPIDTVALTERRKRREAVRGFEEMFVSQLLASMRRTVPAEGEPGTRALWQERFDAEIARKIAESGGIGLSSLLEEGIERSNRRK
jgi:Rod binding domain-containing protein